jgi:hypothetical protein
MRQVRHPGTPALIEKQAQKLTRSLSDLMQFKITQNTSKYSVFSPEMPKNALFYPCFFIKMAQKMVFFSEKSLIITCFYTLLRPKTG